MELYSAHRLARELMDSHGLHEWNITFDHARRRAGMTSFTTSTISLSTPITLLADEEYIHQVVLHEIAHVLAGPRHNHDAVWKAKALRIGGTPTATLSGGPELPTRYVGYCPNGHVITRHRLRRTPVSCAKCCPDFDSDYLITWYDTKAPAA
ncbi:MAG: SprT-like domain-containing protein [Ancrocorticia sp.]|uniref:SprT-like domain-containing protein n=1 Tax=Ancrocorticia sp. TaxID=2593684 RepID=UPI003F8EAB0E